MIRNLLSQSGYPKYLSSHLSHFAPLNPTLQEHLPSLSQVTLFEPSTLQLHTEMKYSKCLFKKMYELHYRYLSGGVLRTRVNPVDFYSKAISLDLTFTDFQMKRQKLGIILENIF